jgi:sugar lactone lactonase YvrE
MRKSDVRAVFLPVAVVAIALAVTLPWAGIRAQGTDILTFDFRIGTASFQGTLAPGEFVVPLGIAVDSTGMIIVTDTEWYTPGILSNRVQVLQPNGTPAMPALTGAGALGAFSYPTGTAVDANDKVVIVDSMNGRILIMDSVANGMTLLHEFGSFGNYDPFDDGAPGPAPLDQFYFPTSVAMKPGTRLLDPEDVDGRIAIVDNSNHRFVLLDSMLNVATGISVGLDTSDPEAVDVNPPGIFEYPWGVTLDGAGRIYVTDTYNHRVQAFSPTGIPLWQFGSIGPSNSPYDLMEPSGILVDATGRHLFVSDRLRSRILRVDLESAVPLSSPLPSCAHTATVGHADRCRITRSDGRILEALVIGGFGSRDGELLSPYGIARTPSNHLLIADTGKHVLQAFGVADLEILEVTATGPGLVGGTHALEVTVKNTGTAPLTTGVAVSGLSLAGHLSPAAPQALEANETATFHLEFVPVAPGALTFNVRATGVDAGGGTMTTALSAADPVEIGPLPTPFLSALIAASPGLVGVGSTITVTVTLVNGGGTAFEEFTPEVSVQPAGSTVVTPAGSSLDLLPLAPGESRELTFTFTAQEPGSVSFGAVIEAAYEDSPDPGVFESYPPVTASSNAVTVQLDVTPPVATATLTSDVAPQNGWYRTPVTVTLSAEDAGTGVKALHFTVAGTIKSSQTVLASSASFTVTQTGVTSFTSRAEDVAGNLSAAQSGEVRLDTFAPIINTVRIVPTPEFGWNNTNVQARFFAGDSHSGLAFVTPQAETTVTTEGANQVIQGIARDLAGNEVRRDVIVHVDKTPPALLCAPSRAPDHNGSYSAAVTVSCMATDQPGLSGVASMTAPQTFTADGIHTFLGEALDRAANLATVTLTIKVDKIPPVMACSTLSGGETWPPNHKLNPWTVTVTPTDPVSGVASLKLVAYWSNEPDNGKGDGNFENDMQGWVLGTPDMSGFIRAERAGSKGGRTYTLRYEAIDNAGNTESCEITTGVPHDQGKGK